MRIEHDVKLTFDDVLIRPKRSTLVSRSDVNLEREFRFRHTDQNWTGVPIVAANMDATGLFSISKVLQGHGMLTCTQKFYSTREFSEAWEGARRLGNLSPLGRGSYTQRVAGPLRLSSGLSAFSPGSQVPILFGRL